MQTNKTESVEALLQEATRLLVKSDSATLDAQLLLAQVLHKDRSWLYAWPEVQVSAADREAFSHLVQQREQGVPIAYLLGEKEFWGLNLQVNKSVLIPRPETELLVEIALELCTKEEALVADLGTGSGAIALALCKEQAAWQLKACDFSAAALEVAKANAKALSINNVEWFQGSWCEALPASSFDLILSNPPYIAESDPHLSEGDVRFEPVDALVAEAEGFADISLIAIQSLAKLKPNAYLAVEHGWQQGKQCREIFEQSGYHEIETRLDYAGRERVTLGRKHD